MKSKTLKKRSSLPEVVRLMTAGLSRPAARTNDTPAGAFRFSTIIINFAFALLLSISLIGCAGGDGGSSPAGVDGAGIPVGGGSPALQAPVLPTVLSISPEDGATDVPVNAVVEMTFSKSMNPNSFGTGLNRLRNSGDQFVCVEETDCKTIRFMPGAFFEYETKVDFELQTEFLGVKDTDGNSLAAPVPWSFTTVLAESFKAPLNFKNVTIDGGGILDKNGIPIEDAGECTSVGVDSKGIIHITYLSVSDSSPKHASCDPNDPKKDCGKQGSWEIEVINEGVINEGTAEHPLGRDINMFIDAADRLHVAYRDVYFCPISQCSGSEGDGFGILKYAVKTDQGWKSVVVDDTTDGVTDPYIKVGAGGRIHISYRSRNRSSDGIFTALSYATCSQDCLTRSNWNKADIERGTVGHDDLAGPSDIFVTESAVHISYRANGTLKYAACLLDNPDSCKNPADWGNVVVDDGGSGGSVGTDNSLFVNDSGVHITYRDNRNADIKYAFCPSSSSCLSSEAWKTAAFDRPGDMGVCTRLRIDVNGFHAVYADRTNYDVKYAFCRADCLKPESWTPYRIDAPGRVGWDAYLALDRGKVHVSYAARYIARDGSDKFKLKYAWGDPPPNR